MLKRYAFGLEYEYDWEDNIFIDPKYEDAGKIARMIKNQGDARGAILEEDNTLVIFNSYGNTHNLFLREFNVRAAVCLIFRIDGEIFVDCDFENWRAGRKHSLDKVFNPQPVALIKQIYKLMGNTKEPWITNWD